MTTSKSTMSIESKEERGQIVPSTPLSIIKEIFIDYYGKDRISIAESMGIIKVYIHFPQITISNSLNLQHLIKDLYVGISFGKSTGKLNTFAYGRTTFSTLEYELGYVHSHVSSSPVSYIIDFSPEKLLFSDVQFSDVCLGSGPIATTINLLKNMVDWENKDITYKSSLYKVLLSTLAVETDRNVRWESLEGGPYKRIEHINVNALSQRMGIISATYNFNAGIFSKKASSYGFPTTCFHLINIAKLILKRAHDAKIVKFNVERVKDNKHLITPTYDTIALELIALQVIRELNVDVITLNLLHDSSKRTLDKVLENLQSNIYSNLNRGLTAPISKPSTFIFNDKPVPIIIYPVDVIDAVKINNEAILKINLKVNPQFLSYVTSIGTQLYSYINK